MAQTKEQWRAWYAANKPRLMAKAKARREADPERHNAAARKWRAENRERHLELCRNWYRKNYVAKAYDVPVDWYNEQLERQKGVCAICGKMGKRRLCVDHDHATGKVRGLLCDYCNVALRAMERTPNWETIARAYLEAQNA